MPERVENRRLSKAVAQRPNEEPVSSLPSKSTLEELRVLFKRYTDEVNKSTNLSQTSKTMYIDFADCFVRWMYGGFKPGSRGMSPRMFRKLRGRNSD